MALAGSELFAVVSIVAIVIVALLLYRARGVRPGKIFALTRGDWSYPVALAGGERFRNELREIVGSGYVYHECVATLRKERGSPHGKGTATAYIEGREVGFLEGERVRQCLHEMRGHRGLDATCNALIIGGAGDSSELSVWLDLPLSRAKFNP